MPDEPTFVFLHGAGTGAWVWERVTRALPLPGVALEVPGRTAGVTPDSCATAIVADLDSRGIGPVILVLHSLAGVLASGLSARLGARVKGCIFVSAIVPPPGGAFIDSLGFANRLILRMLFKFNPGGLKPSVAMIRRALCEDLSEQDAELVVSRYQAEMPGLYLVPTEAPPLRTQCTYVKLLKDRSVSPSQQDAMISRLGNARVHEIDAGHLVMLSKPAALVEVLLRETSLA